MNEKTIELLAERLASRINKANEFFLIKIGESVKKIRGLTPTQAHQLVQILKYGNNYQEIINEISRLTNLNIQDIDAIFNEMAKKDYEFAEQFYKYRGIEYVPYSENKALLRQVSALASITKQEMYNYARTTNLGYSIRDLQGNVKFVGLRETYNRVLDEAVLNVGTGVDTFDNAMSKIMKDIGGNGLKTVDYASGRSIRLDSVARMHLKGALRNLHNEVQKQVGEEFGANMIEVSHHSNSAPDHIDSIDGKQFAMIDILKKQIENGEEKNIKINDIDFENNRVKVKGKWYYDFNYINDNLERKVSTLNCFHYTFSGILGITQPEFSKKELEEDKENNLKGCEIDGKHYTLYEAQELMRNLELNIRKQKDIQILGKESKNKKIVEEAQLKITQLTNKYKEVSKISGLPVKMERLKVAQYRRISTKRL